MAERDMAQAIVFSVLRIGRRMQAIVRGFNRCGLSVIVKVAVRPAFDEYGQHFAAADLRPVEGLTSRRVMDIDVERRLTARKSPIGRRVDLSVAERDGGTSPARGAAPWAEGGGLRTRLRAGCDRAGSDVRSGIAAVDHARRAPAPGAAGSAGGSRDGVGVHHQAGGAARSDALIQQIADLLRGLVGPTRAIRTVGPADLRSTRRFLKHRLHAKSVHHARSARWRRSAPKSRLYTASPAHSVAARNPGWNRSSAMRPRPRPRA